MFFEQGKTFVLARAEVKTETEEQQKLKKTRAHLMRVTSEVRLNQATWSSNARTLRVVMKDTSEMRLWRELASHAHAWDRLHCPYLASTDTTGQKSMLELTRH